MKIVFAGGGTGGHILPIIAVCREIRRIYSNKDLEFFYIGPKDEFGEIFLSHEGIKIKHVLSGKIRRYSGWKTYLRNIVDILFKIPVGILQSFFIVLFLNPDLLFSKGGYGSIPGVISSWLLGVPIFLHESDVVPGMSNRFLSKFAVMIFVSFPRTEYFPPRKMIMTGNPIRREILEGLKGEAKKLFKIDSDKPVVLILGGSQGAQRVNDEILEDLADMLETFEVIHQCGEKNYRQVKSESKSIITEELEKSYHLYPILKEELIKQAYSVCDIIISRAGSGSIFEIAASGKPSILIPLPESAQNHQVKNAYIYAENGATIVMEEINFTSHFFVQKLKFLFMHHDELAKMRKAALEFAKPEAAKTIAQYFIDYLTSK